MAIAALIAAAIAGLMSLAAYGRAIEAERKADRIRRIMDIRTELMVRHQKATRTILESRSGGQPPQLARIEWKETAEA